MVRFAVLLLLASCIYAAESTVDIDTAAKVYQAAQVREQVRASLGAMPEHMRQLFARDAAAQLSDQQLAAVTAAAKRGFRIDVFEAPALRALADNLDPSTVVKVQAFLASDLGKRMVAADVAEAAVAEEISDKIINGELAVPATPKRDLLIEKLERATRSTESQVQIYLAMGEAVAIGTAIGSGQDPAAVAERARKTGEASRARIGGEHAGADAQNSGLWVPELERLGSETLVGISGLPRRKALCHRVQRIDGGGFQRHG